MFEMPTLSFNAFAKALKRFADVSSDRLVQSRLQSQFDELMQHGYPRVVLEGVQVGTV